MQLRPISTYHSRLVLWGWTGSVFLPYARYSAGLSGMPCRISGFFLPDSLTIRHCRMSGPTLFKVLPFGRFFPGCLCIVKKKGRLKYKIVGRITGPFSSSVFRVHLYMMQLHLSTKLGTLVVGLEGGCYAIPC